MRTIFGVRSLQYEDIQRYTGDFSKQNFICKFKYGTVFRGRDEEQEFTVKIWDTDEDDFMMIEELTAFNYRAIVKGHPKPIGFCDEKKCDHIHAIVYKIIPLDTLQNLIPKDNFSWADRIKVALGVALSLESYHSQGFILRNVDPANILCDKDYTPKFYDFTMFCGAFLTARWKFDGEKGSYGYIDPYFLAGGKCRKSCDIFAYGVVLLSLISKRVFNAEKDTDADFINLWAEAAYDQKKKLGRKRPSLVDQSFTSQSYFNQEDGRRITKLAMKCIKYDPDERPKMKEIVSTLKSLRIVLEDGDGSGINKMLKDFGVKLWMEQS